MQYFSGKTKQKFHVNDTKPSHCDSSSNSNHQELLSESNQTFGLNSKSSQQVDSCIKFSNGWTFEGQHFNGKFQGWGAMTSNDGQLVYKGNFLNGFFHKYGKIYFHPFFSYLFQTQQINKWIQKNINLPITEKNNLRQIQVVNPLTMKMSNKNVCRKQKERKKQQITESQANKSTQSENMRQDLSIQWLKYEGDFLQGNATGFGTIKVKLVFRQNKKFDENERIIKIVGKFVDGGIVRGIIY